LGIMKLVRNNKYSHVVNLQRFFSSGLITAFSGAAHKVGFDKNPLSAFFTDTATHTISPVGTLQPVHEVERNQRLIAKFTDAAPAFPRLYPSPEDFKKVADLVADPYICIAPSSVWFTKQFPREKWGALLRELPEKYTVYLIGGPSDKNLCDEIISLAANRSRIVNLCGSFNYLQSAALMGSAAMNYTNDSAPLHFATAMHAPVTAVFCSTVPSFGFGPLRENGRVVQTEADLPCRPCGLHGHGSCPKGHFKCATDINNKQLLWWI
jgi:ADP-heptose:LPS heptosyltransferase